MPASPPDPAAVSPLPGPDAETKTELLWLLADGATQSVNWYAPSDDRFAAVVTRIALSDQIWLLRCIGWLRNTEALAPAGIIVAAELVRARLGSGKGDNRGIINIMLRRPDEPGALLGYWVAAYGRPVPKPVQRGVADAVKKLYSAQAVAEYDHHGRGLRFADVLSIVRPRPVSPQQATLFRQLINDRVPRSSTPDFSAAAPPADPSLGAVLRTAAHTGRLPF
ncbi:hypothetical protein [Actinomadura sp. HBU206391]|uniref:hypothetical protein n=1 Tax=Actinomadura sp. HBU206391 TaxID=2731692 RepID=UPI001650464E|nr:hypothetical protein [Actinomadura sp. HBU206391]MBC6463336.1 hypothetical protein [Actinomadura sp. HBU206391]